MKYIKWLLHPVYLLIIVVAIAVYINRGVLFSHSASASGKIATTAAKPVKVAAAAKSAPADSEVTADASSTDAASAPAVTKETVAKENAAPATPPVAKTAASPKPVPAVSPLPPSAAPKTAAPADATTSAAASGTAAKKTRSQRANATWYRARQAAWNGNTAAAAKAYEQLIKLRPNSADAHGELGNVLLQEGKFKAAAAEYVTAAKRLQADGHMAQAWQLVNAVTTLDAAKGAALRKALMNN